jgi:hypothetical protein
MLYKLIDGLIKGKYNMLTKEEDFFSQVIVASELICRGLPEDIDMHRISKALTYQIKKS